MKKLIVLYKKPEDLSKFLEYYNNTHVPLVRRVPGLLDLVVNRISGTPFGSEPDYFMIVELHFRNEDFDAAMTSDENRAAGKDLKNFAPGLVTLLIADA